MKTLLAYLLKAIFLICILLIAINFVIVLSSQKYIYTDMSEIPNVEAVLVLGAQVSGDRLSSVLEDRVQSGLEIYQLGKADRFLLSGDHRGKYYDEVNAMRKYILNAAPDTPYEAIFLDHAGLNTYDSMYRAKEIFGVQKMVIVTQDFHINRAVYIARSLGIDAVGYSVSQSKYKLSLQMSWMVREFFSRIKAFGNVTLKSKSTLLGEKIPISGDGTITWDK